MKVLRGFLIATTILAALPAAAQTVNPLAEREGRVPPVVSWLQSQGVKLTFLGEEGGVRGYLGESANGKMQTFYVMPDGNHVVAGILFRSGGTNVTGVQIGEMRARFDAAAADLGAQTVQGPDGVSNVAAAPAEPPASQETPEAAAAAPAEPVENPAPPAAPAVPEATEVPSPEAPAPAASIGDVTLPPAEGPAADAVGNPSELWISKIDKDVFLAAAEKTPFFEVGTRNAPATLWMVADPQCPFCHKAWDHVRQSVYAKNLKVRVIMIAGLPGSDVIARDILARPLPARAWLDSNAGRNHKVEIVEGSPEWEKAGEFLEMNMEFARQFGVDRTPFLGYMADDGQFYSALGLPSDLNAFLAASGVN